MKIRKILVAVISLFMAAALFTGCSTANNASKADDLPVIKLGSDSYPPYNYLDEDGNPTGIDVELATEAFARMGYRVEIVQIDWEKKKELVESGAIDCIMGCFSMEGRLDDYQWAGPYIAKPSGRCREREQRYLYPAGSRRQKPCCSVHNKSRRASF